MLQDPVCAGSHQFMRGTVLIPWIAWNISIVKLATARSILATSV